MNYLILDTEKTYNFGILVFSDLKEILYQKNFVIKERLEDRKICGEQTYNSKTKYYAQQDYCNAVEFLTELARVIRLYKIKTFIGHNVQEDKRNIGEIYIATKPFLTSEVLLLLDSFDCIYFLDSVSIVKLFFNNQLLNLQDVISDIVGFAYKQRHVAIEDSILVGHLIIPIAKYLHLFENKEELEFIKSLVNEKVMIQHIGKILFNKSFKSEDIFEDNTEYTIKTLNTRLNTMVTLGLLNYRELPKISQSTGKPLKTMTKIYTHKDTVSLEAISEFITQSKNIKEEIIKNVIHNAKADDNTLDKEIDKVKEHYANEYDLKVQSLINKEIVLTQKQKDLTKLEQDLLKTKKDYEEKVKIVDKTTRSEVYGKFKNNIELAISKTGVFSKSVKDVLEDVLKELNN